MICNDEKPARGLPEVATLASLDEFDAIIDARSPGEYVQDHIPGAINLPVLDDEERARVGTIYKQVSPFEAKRLGAALVSHNIARHLESYLADKPKKYRPLVYCWRGGTRSGSMTHVLRSIGWQAAQLEGGYKRYRTQLIADLESWPARFHFLVVCGPTGVGKSRLLRALAEAGGQVLDLEELAAHMGSVLGAYPDQPQPSQKYFESRIWATLRRFDPGKPVYVESESKKIGKLHTPEELLQRMRDSDCLNLNADIPLRVRLLKQEYAHFLASPDQLNKQLDRLVALRGRETIERWKDMASGGEWDELVAELLESHYDPAYTRSLEKNYYKSNRCESWAIDTAEQETFHRLAGQILDAHRAVS